MRRLVAPGYAAAIMIIMFAFVDFATAIRPVELGSADWRFGAVGFLSGSLVTLMFAGLIALALAFRFEHLLVQRVIGTVSIAAALFLALAAASFFYDGLHVRGRMQPDAANTFNVAMGRALIKLFTGAVVAGIFGWSAFRSSGRHTVTKPAEGPLARARSERSLLVTASSELGSGD